MGRRPPIAGRKDQLLAVKVTPGLIAAIDRWATERSMSRPDAVRRLVRIGMNVPPDIESRLDDVIRERAEQVISTMNT